MGEVWAVEHVALRRRMALKMLRATDLPSEQQRVRFLREARVVSTIEHPGVIEITDFGELPNGAPFLAMKLLEGRTLRRLLEDDGALPWPRAVALLEQVAAALGEAHRQGVVHRDLKPDNVFISPGPPERATVIDFGIARRTAFDSRTAKLTATGTVFGTPGYMAPEQIRGQPAESTADVYALGCIAYELLTGQRVFTGELFERLEAHLYRAPPSLPASIPTGLRRVVERCLAKAPDERLQSMDAVLSALSQASGTADPATGPMHVHVPVAPPGSRTPATRPTRPGVMADGSMGFAPAPATLAPHAAEPPKVSRRRRWVVAALSMTAGLSTLAVIHAARTRAETTSASPPAQSQATPTGATSKPIVAPPEPEPEPEPDPLANATPPPADPVAAPPPAEPQQPAAPAPKRKVRGKRKARSPNADAPEARTPKRRDDDTFDIFPDP